LKSSGISEGLITISVPGSTAGVTTIEFEPGLVKDLKEAFEKIAPSNRSYNHDKTWGDGNGFSHVRAALLGASRSFPVQKKKILIGTWQQVGVIDFDNRPRQRAVVIQVIGEK
jgi:secondary thiamine-phosphate synthase enzyme